MARNSAHDDEPRNSGRGGSSFGFGRMILLMTIISFAGLFIYKYLNNGKALTSISNAMDPTYTSEPQEMEITYIPKDFDYELDDENTIAILSNPHRYKREFNSLVFQFNTSLLDHVANRMDIGDEYKAEIREKYKEHHAYLARLYYNDYIALKDTSDTANQTWYNNEATSSVDAMNEVASRYACFLVNSVLLSTLEQTNGTFLAKGSKVDTPCGIALNEGLKPTIKRLEQKAAIIDFSQSKGLMEERIEKVIAELATLEVRDQKGLNKKLQTKVWGYSVSTTDLDISAISVLKVGFKLDQYFKVDANGKNKTLVVTLPEPQILSHEVYPKIDKLDIGWLREVKEFDLNKNFNVLRKEFRRDALDDDVMDKAKSQATEVMHIVFDPLMQSIGSNYSLIVKFKNVGGVLADDFNIEKGDAEMDMLSQ